MGMYSLKKKEMPKDRLMDLVDPYFYLPSFSLTEKQFPPLKDWKVGKKYKMEIEVEQVSMSKNEYADRDEPLTARFKIHKVGEEEMYTEEEKKGRMGHY